MIKGKEKKIKDVWRESECKRREGKRMEEKRKEWKRREEKKEGKSRKEKRGGKIREGIEWKGKVRKSVFIGEYWQFEIIDMLTVNNGLKRTQ